MSENVSKQSRSPTSIRGQILTLLWLAVLPLTALHLYTTYEGYRRTIDHASEQAFGLAEEVATSTEQFLSTVEAQLTGAADRYGRDLTSLEGCLARIVPLHANLGYLDNLGFQDQRGYTTCWTLPMDPDAPSYFGDEAWFDEVRVASGLVLSRPVFAPLSSAWVVSVHVAVRDDEGRFLGSLSGTLPLARFQSLIGGVEATDDELVSIVTADRTVVARSREPEAFVGTEYANGIDTRQAVAPGRWLNRLPDADGIDRTWAIMRLRAVDWDVVAGLPTDQIRGPAVADTIRNWSLNAVVIVLVILVIFSIHRRIVGSLHDLVDGVGLAAEGHPVPLPGRAPEEVASVVETLNQALSARARAEASERAAKNRFRAILDNAVFGIFTSTADGRFLDVNPAMASMLGYDSPEELIQAGPLALYSDPADRQRLVDLGLDQVENLETRWRTRSGGTITVRVNGKAVELEDGTRAFEMIAEDITQAKIIDDQLRQTQKMEAIGRLAGGIAHDFNNLLTVISLNGELLLSDVSADDPLRAGLREIAEAADRAETLTSQLLAFSRNEEAKAEDLDANEVVRGLEKMLSRLLTESIRVDTVLDAARPMIHVDRGRLEQVIVNLVVNARDAMPHGGRIGLHTSTAARPPVVTSSEDVRSWVCIAVDDEGVGMDEETRSRIFEPFFTTKPQGEGSGLGLATAYGIAGSMGGHLHVTSEPGVGSRFELWLPASARAGAAAPVEQAVPEGAEKAFEEAGHGETVLVVEDEAQIRRVVERMLVHAGYRVILARDGQEALTIASEPGVPIDLVVTDVVMPRMHGTDLAQELVRIRPGTPVLYMSGYTFELPVGKRIDQEAFLAKPFTAAQLRGKVRKLLDVAAAARPASSPERSG